MPQRFRNVDVTKDFSHQGYYAIGNVTFSIAQGGSSNITLVTIQIQRADGVNIAEPRAITVWLSDAATGAGLTGTTTSGTVVAGTKGVDFGDLTAKKAKVVQTDVSGTYILSITDTAKTGFYVCVGGRITGRAFVSRQLVTGDYK